MITPIEPVVTQLRCPTCGAWQDISDVCRRCKCDLSLVVPLLRERQRLRQSCLAALHDGRYAQARSLALRCCTISRDADNLQLLALTELLTGQYAAALELMTSRE
ncbi:MAG: hypothetical protein MUF48_11155 [Pirellulaceae bacterium]|jgi:hypothetical protein|nr:hypothetical protein [Pirellulaceae bacterium]